MDKVTITGADDSVDPGVLVELGQQYPFVEWGILLSPKRFGSDRYPSTEWLRSLRNSLPRSRGVHTGVSLHLCGDAAQSYMEHDGYYTSLLPNVDRIQINGTQFRSPKVSFSYFGGQQIFTAKNLEDMDLLSSKITKWAGPLFAVLWDVSGGKGINGKPWPVKVAGADYGLAGGIGPSNIEESIDDAVRVGASWIDMESSVRTSSGAFDLDAVRLVLARADGKLKALKHKEP